MNRYLQNIRKIYGDAVEEFIAKYENLIEDYYIIDEVDADYFVKLDDLAIVIDDTNHGKNTISIPRIESGEGFYVGHDAEERVNGKTYIYHYFRPLVKVNV